ncbi:MAG TPA: NAD(P)H-quinone oxidoreductase [Thermoanaerobaculia bacterium]|nr:NAD(P)H-quinone oxidoreductase [Thermoanaerobaculia bacterium]
MRAAVVEEKQFRIAEVEPPQLGTNDLRIRVGATAVNRADLLQREGRYPPPPGVSEIIGLECSGVVSECGENVRGWSKGDRAMALLPGGGYAEEVVVHAGSAMHVPDALSDEEAAAVPEVFLTAFSNIFILARAKRGESILIHGGGSGVGTAATTLCKLNEMRVIVTAGSDEKCAQCIRHGADVAINYRTEDFVEKANGVDIVLDHIGAKYLVRDLEALGLGGRVVIIGSMGGDKTATIDVTRLLGKRQQIIGSTLRARPVDEKAAIVAAFVERFGGALNEGHIKPVIDRVYELHEVEEAHRRVAADHFGKVVLRVNR